MFHGRASLALLLGLGGLACILACLGLRHTPTLRADDGVRVMCRLRVKLTEEYKL